MYEPLWSNGTVSVTFFSLAVFAATLIGSALLLALAGKKRCTDDALSLLPLTLLFGVFFGHFLFAVTRVLIYPLDYENPLAFILNPSVGGFMYLGVVGGAAWSALVIGRIKKVSVALLMKLLLPALLITLAMIRFAEPLDGQGKGPEISGGFFPISFAPEADYPDDRYIPVFFYEGVYALLLALFAAKNTLKQSENQRPSMYYFVFYLAGQMFFEVYRQDEYVNATSLITFIRLNQLFAVILLGGYLVYSIIKSVKNLKRKEIVIRVSVFAISVGACIGLQFLFDKPLPFFGQTIWFADWLVYLLLALAAVGMGWPVISLMNSIPRKG